MAHPHAGASITECENCAEVRAALHVDPVPLSLVSMYRKPSQLREWLTRYKGRPDSATDTLEPEYVEVVRALLGRYLHEHGAALDSACGGVEALVVVPSTEPRPSHPLEAVITSLDLSIPLLKPLVRGDAPLDFRTPNANGYEPTLTPAQCGHTKVLLVDDVYTTGSRLNSAAVALRRAGFVVSGALVIARRVNPDYKADAREFWEQRTQQPFTWASPVVASARSHQSCEPIVDAADPSGRLAP